MILAFQIILVTPLFSLKTYLRKSKNLDFQMIMVSFPGCLLIYLNQIKILTLQMNSANFSMVLSIWRAISKCGFFQMIKEDFRFYFCKGWVFIKISNFQMRQAKLKEEFPSNLINWEMQDFQNFLKDPIFGYRLNTILINASNCQKIRVVFKYLKA